MAVTIQFDNTRRFRKLRQRRLVSPPKREILIKRNPVLELSGVAPCYNSANLGECEFDDGQSLNGIFSKIHKLHKKLRKPLTKLLPKPIRKLDAKIDKKVEKIANNKKLNQVGNIAAAAVATYFTAGAASPLLKKQIEKVVIDKQKAQDKKELIKAQAEVEQAQKAFDATANDAVNSTLTAEQQAIVQNAYKQQGAAAFSDPNIAEMLRGAVQKTTADMAVQTFPNAQVSKEQLTQAAEQVADDKVNSVTQKDLLLYGGLAGAGLLIYLLAKR